MSRRRPWAAVMGVALATSAAGCDEVCPAIDCFDPAIVQVRRADGALVDVDTVLLEVDGLRVLCSVEEPGGLAEFDCRPEVEGEYVEVVVQNQEQIECVDDADGDQRCSGTNRYELNISVHRAPRSLLVELRRGEESLGVRTYTTVYTYVGRTPACQINCLGWWTTWEI